MSRGVFLLGVGIALVAMAFALTDWMLGLRLGVSEANVRRIRLGMTFEEVEAILGQDFWLNRAGGTISWFQSEYLWFASDGVALVQFTSSISDRRARVESAQFRRGRHHHPFQQLRQQRPLQRLRAGIGW
jgi:hypothetical protein